MAGSLAQETRHLWLLARKLAAAVDKNDKEGISEYREAIEFMVELAEYPNIRKVAARWLNFILFIRPVGLAWVLPPAAAVAGTAD